MHSDVEHPVPDTSTYTPVVGYGCRLGVAVPGARLLPTWRPREPVASEAVPDDLEGRGGRLAPLTRHIEGIRQGPDDDDDDDHDNDDLEELRCRYEMR